MQAGLKQSESEGQRRMLALHEEIAERIKEYAVIGIDEFILSGYPHLEEAYRFGEGVLPLLEDQGLWQHPDAPATGPLNVPFAV